MIEGRIERSCYAPSDKICLTATFGNYSKRSVNPVVELIQEIKYNTEDYTKEEEIVRTLFKGKFYLKYIFQPRSNPFKNKMD